MHQVQLTDHVYDQVKRRADEAGFKSVDEYVADVLINVAGEPDLDHLFTAERIARIEKAAAQVEAGESYSMEETHEHLAEVRADWIRKNGQ